MQSRQHERHCPTAPLELGYQLARRTGLKRSSHSLKSCNGQARRDTEGTARKGDKRSPVALIGRHRCLRNEALACESLATVPHWTLPNGNPPQ